MILCAYKICSYKEMPVGEIRYGVLSPAETAGMTGRQIMQAIIDGLLPQPPICEALTFRLTEIGDGTAVFEGEPGPHLLNPMGGVHGGWVLTLIDSAGGCAGLSTLPAGSLFTTLETKANFTRPITPTTGPVKAEAQVIGRGRQVMSAEVRVFAADRKVLAHGTTTLLAVPAP